ncbi:MAG: hypothetical protein GY749_30715 [Desulfobacteraceae bacterium]|nr:hypothetical protein [Desulfobacteraceae bacterium]
MQRKVKCLKTISLILIFVVEITCCAKNDSHNAYSTPLNLKENKDFFEAQKEEYQRWLDYTGIGQVLNVHSIKIKRNKLLLYMGTVESNNVIGAWDTLKDEFEKNHFLTLEKRLFYRMLHTMDISEYAEYAKINIYATYDVTKERCFYQS